MRVKSLLPFAATSAIALAAGGAHATTMAYTTSASFISAATGGSAPAGQVADQVNWAVFASTLNTPSNNGSIPYGSQMTTSAGEGVKVTNSTNPSNLPFTTYVEGAGLWDGNFSNGTTVLYNGGVAGESTTLAFTSALSGLGVDLQTYHTGSYTFTLTAYDSNLNVLGSAVDSGVTYAFPTGGNLTHENSVSFAGITSTSANISYVTITSSDDNNGFAIDTSIIYHNNLQTGGTGGSQQTPEPGTLGLLGAGLTGLGMIRRKFRRKDRTARQT